MVRRLPTDTTVSATPAAAGERRRVALGATLAAVVALGVAVRVWGIDFGLPYTQARPDETQVMEVALNYLRGNFWPQFYDYPRLYSYLLVLAYLAYYAVGRLAGDFASVAAFVATWPTDWAPFFLINRSLSAAAGSLTVPIVYLAGRRVGDAGTGLVAAFFMAVAYGHVRDSHFGTTDTTLSLLCIASVVCLLGNERPGRRRDVLAAVCAGLASATKYNGIILGAPLAISQVLHAWRQPSGRLRGLLDARALAIGAAFALAFAVGVPFVFFDYQNFQEAMHSLFASLGVQPGVPARVNGWWYHASVSLPYGLGVPLLASAIAGIGIAAWREWRTAIVLFVFPVAYFAVAGWLGTQFARYAWPILPFACVAAGITVTAIVGRFPVRGRWRAAALVTLTLALAWPSMQQVAGFDRVMAQTDSRVVAATWLDQHAEPGTSVMVSGSLYGYPDIGRQFEVWSWSRTVRAFVWRGRPAVGEPDWILVQESPLPSTTQPEVIDLLNRGYHRLTTIKAFDPETGNLYDRKDAFFVPLAGFAGVRRPGPNFTVYKHPRARYLVGGAAGGRS